MLDPSPPPAKQGRLMDSREGQDSDGAPTPSSVRPIPTKRRRVTISGTPHPLNTDLRLPPTDQTSSTPISPAVIGFTIMRDDPTAMEQVRSTLTVKQKQQALIEQRRGSVAGTASTPSQGHMSGNNSAATPSSGNPMIVLSDDRLPPKPPPTARTARRSPNAASGGSNPRRGLTVSSGPQSAQPPSPSPIIVPSQAPPGQHTSHSLPTPPISFARRRAGQLGPGKKKPADIVISPREFHTAEQFAPAIHSAPPISHGQFASGRPPMSLPRLPSVMNAGESMRRVSTAQVPPTPTRFSMLGNVSGPSKSASGHLAPPAAVGISRRSPPASIPISNTLVPPTPSTLHNPEYSGDKSAFLSPFELFYDALNDSKQMKNWLGEQLHRSNALLQTLTQQQERMDEIVEAAVERKMGRYREEVMGLHRRVEELEDALRTARDDNVNRQLDAVGIAKVKSRGLMRNNGIPQSPVVPEGYAAAYTFPPVEPYRRRPSPSWRQEREKEQESQARESESRSPAPFDVHRRMSISAIRLDPPRQPTEPSSTSSPSSPSRPHVPQSPSHHSHHPPSHAHAKKSSSHMSTTSIRTANTNSIADRPPTLLRQHSHGRSSYKTPHSNPSEPSASPRSAEAGPSPKVGNSRRNSITQPSPGSPPGSAMDVR
jgi:hypothetical protein